MPRYEFVEGSSSKFWEITLEGTSFTTTYGRIGTDGQTTMKEYDSEEKARKEHDKLVAEKEKKGYVLVGGAGAAPPAPAPAASKAAAPPPAKAKPAKGAVFDDEGDDEDDDDPKPAAAKPAALAKPAAAPKAAKPSAPAGASKSGEAGARYFELVDGSSSKFWEIKLEGSSFTTRYGRIGTDGQMSMKEHDSEDKARREYDKLVSEKTKKGYVEK